MLLRVSALMICAAALLGIAIELATVIANGSAAIGAVWLLLGYFTILTNLLVAVVFGAIVLGGQPANRPKLLALVVSAIVLVGVVFALLLSGSRELVAATEISNTLLHQLTPALALLFWFGFVPKGHLSWRDPFVWALYPIAYLVYGLVRGGIEGRYAYPFIDVGALGWVGVLLNAVLIAAGFLLAGALLVAIDRWLGRRTGSVDA